MNNAIERRIVHYSGNVQGVGFRATTYRIARGFPVAGYVQNLPDGRVRMEVQGESRRVACFLAAIQDQLGDYIQDADVQMASDLDGFDGFDIRFRSS